MDNSTVTILTILVTVIGVIGLLQLVILFVAVLALKKGMIEMSGHAAELKTKINPLIDESTQALSHAKIVMAHCTGLMDQTRSLIARIEPKIEAAAADLADITRTASDEIRNLQESADEITGHIRRQAARVDSLTTGALNGVDRAGHFVGNVVTSPIRQVSGIVAAAKAIVDSLRRPARPGAPRTVPNMHDERTPEKRDERSYYTGPEAGVR